MAAAGQPLELRCMNGSQRRLKELNESRLALLAMQQGVVIELTRLVGTTRRRIRMIAVSGSAARSQGKALQEAG